MSDIIWYTFFLLLISDWYPIFILDQNSPDRNFRNQTKFYTLNLSIVSVTFAKPHGRESKGYSNLRWKQQSFLVVRLRRTKLIVDRWCGRLLHFTGHGACYTALATSLTVGSASTLDSHGWLFVLCIFSRGVIPAVDTQTPQQSAHQVVVRQRHH